MQADKGDLLTHAQVASMSIRPGHCEGPCTASATQEEQVPDAMRLHGLGTYLFSCATDLEACPTSLHGPVVVELIVLRDATQGVQGVVTSRHVPIAACCIGKAVWYLLCQIL